MSPRRPLLSFLLVSSLAVGASAPASVVEVRCEDVFEHGTAEQLLETITETSEEVRTRYQKVQEAIRLRWGRNFDPGLNPITPLRAGDFREATVRSLKTIYNHPTQFLFGIDGLKMRSPVGKLLRRIWDNPHLQLTEAEEQLLADNDLAEVANRQREFSKARPTWRFARKSADRSMFVVLTAALLLAIDHTTESLEHVMTFDEYEREPSFVGGTPVVHLLTETTPYPHSALRIGDKVYYYGMRRIGADSVERYLHSPSVGPQQSRQWWMPAIFEGIVSNAMQTGNFDRAIRFTEIKVSPAQITAMRTELESRRGQHYFDFPPLTSEDTMLMKFLRRHTGVNLPSVIEMNPNLTQMNLLLNPLALRGQVGRRGLLVPRARSTAFLAAKSILVDYLEMRIFMGSLLFGTPVREAFDLASTEDALRWWDPPGAAQVAAWKTEAQTRLNESLPGPAWEKELTTIGQLPAGPAKNERVTAARERIREVLTPLATEAAYPLTNDTSGTKELLVAQTKLEVLDHLAHHWDQLLLGSQQP